jgi:M6 family metalloprotease-like protein
LIRHCIACFAIAFGSTAAAEPAKAPSTDLAGYLSVDQAKKVASPTPDATNPGATGYLGLTVERNPAGRPIVDTVQPKSPAEAAGIRKGDLITHVGDRPVSTPLSFREWIQSYPPDKSVKITYLRDGKSAEATATLTATSRPKKLGSGPAPYLGLVLEEVKEGDGVKVQSVAKDSPAEKAGLKVGDWVLKLNGDELNRPGRLRDVLEGKRPGDELTFLVVQDKKETELKAKLTDERPRGKGGFGGGGGGFGGGGFGGGRGGLGPPPLFKEKALKVAVIGIEFPDIKHNAKVTPEELGKLFLSRDKYTGKNATGDSVSGSLSDYLNEVSAGKFQLEGEALGWVEVGKKRGDYVQGSGTSNRTAVLSDALTKLTSGDKKDILKEVKGILFVYAGARSAPNRGAVYYPHAGMIRHQGQDFRYMLVPEGGSSLTALNGMVKEAGLLLGLPELAARTENIGSEGLGPWCAMSDPLRTGKAQHYSAWCKEKLGWLEPAIIDPTVKQMLVLAPIEGSPKECFKVLVRPDGSEYLLLENRARKGFDADLPGEGLLIWRVVGDRPILEESHGVEGPTGPTVHLSSVPYPSPANNSFTPMTIPSSRSPKGGGLPVHITNIKRHPDGRVSFQIGYEYE